MERLQQGLVASGVALFLIGMTITLGPATGLLDGPSVGFGSSGDATSTPAPEQQESTAETPRETAASDGGAADDGSEPTPTDDEPLIDAEADLGNDGTEEDEEDEEAEDEEEEDENEDSGDEPSDRGNGEKRGHEDEKSTDSFADGLGTVLG